MDVALLGIGQHGSCAGRGEAARHFSTRPTAHLCHAVPAAWHPEVVSKILGHPRVSITLDVYRHVLNNERRSTVVDLFDAVPAAPVGVPVPLN